MIRIRLFWGEQDGKTFDLPDDINELRTADAFDVDEPPLHIWVLPVLAERELIDYHGRESVELRDLFTTCAYRFADDLTDIDGEVLELHYERDVSADRTVKPDL